MLELEQIFDGIGIGAFDAITQFQTQSMALLQQNR